MAGGDDFQSRATEAVKRILTVGVGAIFLTEESLRSLVSEFKLPKEFLNGVLESAGKTRTQFFSRLSSDVMDRVMTKVDPASLLHEVLEKHEIEMTIRLNFKSKGKTEKEGPPRERSEDESAGPREEESP